MIDNNIQLIIPMSGIGKRFIDAGYEKTKSLIDVDGYPIIKHVVDLFPGVKDVIFICNDIHLKQTNMRKVLNDIFNPSDPESMELDCVFQLKKLCKDLYTRKGKISDALI